MNKELDGYTDIIAMRHPRQGAAQYAQDSARVPILNGGDGAGHHPTQTMLDLFTIKQAHGKLEGLKVILAGDLRYGRTVHSLSPALTRFNCELIFAKILFCKDLVQAFCQKYPVMAKGTEQPAYILEY